MTSGLKATSDRGFFVPLWIRWSALLQLALLFGCAIYVFLMATQGMMRSEWIAPALSVLQFAGTGALALLVMFFVERGHSAPHLTALADEFLTAEIPRNLHKIERDRGPFKPWFARRRTYRRLAEQNCSSLTISGRIPPTILSRRSEKESRCGLKRMSIVLICVFLPGTSCPADRARRFLFRFGGYIRRCARCRISHWQTNDGQQFI
jgi:hypothetical protein